MDADREMQYFRYAVQLRYSAIIDYRHWLVRGKRPERTEPTMAQCAKALDTDNPFHPIHHPHLSYVEHKRPYSGTLTSGALSRLKCALDVALLRIPTRKIYNTVANCTHPFQCSFVTLTHSCTHLVPYSVSYPLLESFLRWLRASKKAQIYIWKLELQERGQIHYHILSDAFVHWSEVRLKWNKLQASAGLILPGMNPNSTDIHALYKVDNVGAYISKYISKDAGSEEKLISLGVKKCYGVSDNIKGVKRPSIHFDMRDFEDCEMYVDIQRHFLSSFEVADNVYFKSFTSQTEYKNPASYYSNSRYISPILDEWKKSISYQDEFIL